MEGVFIALDGTDASVTEAQFRLLAARLREARHNVETFSFPQLDQPSSHFVREYLNGRYGTDEDVGPYTGSLLYALDMYQAASRIREAVKEGKIVLAHHYSASTMAEQGQKFLRPEERRGFFLWLEGLETRMFGLPRPAVSIVLRVPSADSPDILTEAYDDLCQLFPKDYSRLDGARNGHVLPDETIHSLILAKITPLLPTPAHITAAGAHPDIQPETQEEPAPENDNEPFSRQGVMHITIEEVSSLLAADISSNHSITAVERPKDPGAKFAYYLPDELDDTTRSEYRLHLNRILEIHSEMSARLTEHLLTSSNNPEQVRLQVLDLLSPSLPVAVTSTFDILGTENDMESLILQLRSSGTREAATTADRIITAARQNVPDAFRASDARQQHNSDGQPKHRSKVADLSSKHLAGTHSASDSANVTLVDIWPRNEFDLVPDMLYEHSTLPLADIRKSVSAWSYVQKVEVMQAYLGDKTNHGELPGRALEKARYSWDVQSDFGTLRNMQRMHVFDNVHWQPLTPRYGFDVSDIIDESGLTDDFEECFAISLKLHSLLQQARFAAQSPYATLHGHKLRMQVHFNARQAFQLFEQTGRKPGYQNLITQMQEKLAEYHPLITEAAKFAAAGENSEPALSPVSTVSR